MTDFWTRLFDTTGFVPRAKCGLWTPGLIRLHNVSDFLIWTAYLAIPVVLIGFAWKRRRDLPFRSMFALFGIFILACGTTHLMDIVMFYYPLYRLSGLVKLVTAAASWGTVCALVGLVPRALAMRAPDELEREIAARRDAEEKLRASEEQFRAFMDHNPAVAVIKDEEGRYVFVNRTCQEQWSGTIADWIGKTDRELFPDVADKVRAVDREILTSGVPRQVQQTVSQPDGPHEWLSYKFPIQNQQQRLLGVVSIDISERERARRDAEVFAARLENSNRELEEFAFIASHDLQEPLRKIQAFGDRLKTRYGNEVGDEGRDYIERMQNSSERMRVLIDDLLQFARVTTKAGPPRAIDLNEIAALVTSDLEERLRESGGQIEVGVLPVVCAESRPMQQLLQNLLSNALKFSAPGVLPVVRVYEETNNLPECDKEFCRIVVADNGIGFDEKYADRIFGAFQRLHGKQQYEGTGIGLAICRKIVQHYGGQIGVTSTPGAGARFFFDLPRGENRCEEESESSQKQDNPQSTRMVET